MPMPAPTRSDSLEVFSTVYHRPGDIPNAVLDTLKTNPRTSNIVLPYVEKALNYERQGGTFSIDQFWIACFTGRKSISDATLDFFLSCTDGPMGKYPIFIVPTRPSEQLEKDFLLPRIECLVGELQRNVAFERVFSVFAPTPVAQAFANIWSQFSGIGIEIQPYYSAKFTYCTSASLRYRKTSSFPGQEISLRLATEEDLDITARLCHGFAAESEPFTLSIDGAKREAAMLTANQQLWVHEIKRQGHPKAIASIAVVTRENVAVSAITKVYTNPDWRQRGCAERLVREVCRRLLRKPGKESVVLYVSDTNPAAEKVYHRVGFMGLTPESKPVPGVEPWQEVGFDQSVVQLGHW